MRVDRTAVTEAEQPVVFIIGLVDSGAHRTLLPISLADELGLARSSELVEDAGSSGGIGSMFKTWSSTVTIMGQIAAFVDGGPDPAPWGPAFPLTPGFTDLEPEPSALLGRADFFQAFEITFNEGPDAPTFSVSPI